MKSKIKTAILVVIGIHITTYFLFGDFMLEHEMFVNFKDFNDRRTTSIYNKNVSEKFYFASCGDEFFRDRDKLNEFIEEINPKNYQVEDDGFYQRVLTIDMSHDITNLLESETSDNEDVTCIIFNTCRLSKIPFIYTQVVQEETFSTHTDYHAMIFNDQYVQYETHYVWFLFKWFKIVKIIKE